MLEKIKKFYSSNKIWISLIRYIFISIVLSILAILIDTKYIPVLSKIPTIFLTSVELAKTILSTLSGALLTITTFTFSTIMVVLTMYSSDFSPRVVNNFLTDKTSIKVLGIFVGGFFYSLITLFFMRNTFSEYLVVSATIGVIYAAVSIIYFVIFVYKVSSSIQATKLIKRVYDESNRIIEKSLQYKKKQVSLNKHKTEIYNYNYKIKSTTDGYLQIMNLDTILDTLKDADAKLIIHPHIGDFVGKNEIIADIYYNDDFLEDSIEKEVLEQLTLGDERLSFNDYRFSLQKIVDIALRALSPGINDPNTAIHCINILGVLVGKLSSIEDSYTVIEEEDFKGIIVYEDFEFSDELYLTFYQIVNYGKKDISVVVAIFEALNRIGSIAKEKNLETLKEFSDYVYDASIDNFSHSFDRKLIKKYRYSIEI